MKPSPQVSLLLTNLRLLDYERSDREQPDPFPLSPAVFTSLQNKAKAFEHIVHHLFRSLDPAECNLRFQGCWPVYEPAQARDLRNAVFKWLNDLKAAGHLRGVIVRRTTLDECAGERYEELLLSLSTMVLQERIEKGGFGGGKLMHTQAFQEATSLEPSTRTLQTLLWAHQSAVTKVLDARAASKAEWSSFSTYLSEKEREIEALAQVVAERSADAEEPPQTKAEQRAKASYEESVRNKWRDNWLGDPAWLEILLNGDPELSRDRFLELPFDTALSKHHHFREGKIQAAGGAAVSLAGLERQVAEQRRRVDELRKLREEALAPIPGLDKKPAEKEETKKERTHDKSGLKVEFRKHAELHLKNTEEPPTAIRFASNNFTELLDSLRDELASADTTTRRVREKPDLSFQHEPDMEYEESFAMTDAQDFYDGPSYADPDVSMMSVDMPDAPDTSLPHEDSVAHDGNGEPKEQEPENKVHELDPPSILVDMMDEDGPALLPRCLSPTPSPAQRSPPKGRGPLVRESFGTVGESPDHANSPTPSSPPPSESYAPSSAPSTSPPSPLIPPSPPIPTLRKGPRPSMGLDDDVFAERLVADIAAAASTPSPAKRTAGVPRALSPDYDASPSFSIDESPLPGGFHQSSERRNSSRSRLKPSPLPFQPRGRGAGSNGRKVSGNSDMSSEDGAEERQLAEERYRQLELARSVTPTEELLASEDYNSVFKSRPKIATSPMFAPSPGLPRGNLNRFGNGNGKTLQFGKNGAGYSGWSGKGGKGIGEGDKLSADEMDLDALSAEEFSDDEAFAIIGSPLKGRG